MSQITHDIPPRNERAERIVLSAMVRTPDTFVPLVVSLGVTAGDFYEYPHRLVFTRLVELFNGRGVCDLASLYRVLYRSGELVELGPLAVQWLADLTDLPPWFDDEAVYEEWSNDEPLSTACVRWAVGLVLWLSERRDAIHLARVMLRDAMDGIEGPRRRREAMAV